MDNSTIVLLWVAACYCLIICVLGFIVNLVALICIVKSPNLNNGMKVILFNAFLPSFLISSFIMPFFFKLFVPSSEETKLPFKCEGKIPFPDLIFGFLSALTLIELIGLALLAFYRLLAISSPSHYFQWISILRTGILCALNWLFSLTAWGLIWGFDLITFNSDHCFFEGNNILIQRIIAGLIYGIPLLLTVVFLIATHIKINQQNTKSRAIRSSTHSLHDHKINLERETTMSSSDSTATSSSLEKNSKKHGTINDTRTNTIEKNKLTPCGKRDSFYKRGVQLVTKYYTLRSSPLKKEANRFLKATKNIWIILVLFCLINIPHVAGHIALHESVAGVFIILHIFHWVHLVIDPLIYILLNKRDFLHVYQNFKTKVKCSSV